MPFTPTKILAFEHQHLNVNIKLIQNSYRSYIVTLTKNSTKHRLTIKMKVSNTFIAKHFFFYLDHASGTMYLRFCLRRQVNMY